MRNRKIFIALFMAFIFSLAFQGCSDDPSFVGMETLPQGEVISAGIHEKLIKIVNVYRDSIRSDGPTESSFAIIGHFNDINIGSTKADFVTEVSIPEGLDTFNISSAYSPDSLILCLAYSNNSWYGDTLKKLNIKIYELDRRLTPAGKYYSNESMDGAYKPVLLAERLVSPKDGIHDTIWTTSGYENILRFNLNLDNGALMNRIFNLSGEDLSHRDAFKDVLNGFYITCDDVTEDRGALININLRSTNSNLRFYYKRELIDNNTDEFYGLEPDSCTFPINKESKMFNRFKHEWTNGVQFEKDSSERIFLQGMAGSFAQFDLSDLINAWRDSISAAKDYEYSFSGITLEFYSDTVIKEDLNLYLDRQPYIAIYEEKEPGDFAIPTYQNRYENNVVAFYEGAPVSTSSTIPSYATYSASSNKFVFRMNAEYFDQLVRDSNMEIKPFYLRTYNNPEFSFRRAILLNSFNEVIDGENISYPPKITVKYVKYRR